jgi:hypothetical protein
MHNIDIPYAIPIGNIMLVVSVSFLKKSQNLLRQCIETLVY